MSCGSVSGLAIVEVDTYLGSGKETEVGLPTSYLLTVAVSEIWDILEMGKKNARTFLKF